MIFLVFYKNESSGAKPLQNNLEGTFFDKENFEKLIFKEEENKNVSVTKNLNNFEVKRVII